MWIIFLHRNYITYDLSMHRRKENSKEKKRIAKEILFFFFFNIKKCEFILHRGSDYTITG